jgi:methionyl aminopeptidase
LFFQERIELKTPEEIDKLRIAGQAVGYILKKLPSLIAPGITTLDIDNFVKSEIEAQGMIPAFFHYPPGGDNHFPANACISVNDEIVHGIASKRRKLAAGDIVSVDLGTIYEGFYGDAAKTYPVGKISNEARKLLQVTEDALNAAIEVAKPGKRLGDIGYTISKIAHENGFSVIEEYGGHGIGRRLHEAPHIPNFGAPNTGVKLEPGMVLAIEPMINMGGREIKTLDDGWTVVTKDGKIGAHFEHTVVLTKDGNEIITKV